MVYHKAFARWFGAAPIGLALLTMALIWGSSSGVHASAVLHTTVFQAQQDAYVLSSSPATNYGAGAIGVIPDSQGYVQFDLSPLPPAATIEKAMLRLKPADRIGEDPSTIGVGRIDAAWSEMTVTWASKPAVTPGGPSALVDSYDWIEWDVTPLIAQWYNDPTLNHGFVLNTSDPGVYFHGKEDGPAPELVVQFSVEADDANRPRPDLGDAPDSTNHHALPSPAYAGPVAGNFPTVWQDPTGAPAGPRHLNQVGQAILGEHISAETEADLGADADGPNNLASGAAFVVPDRDRGDDGWRNRHVPFPNCRRTTLTIRVSKAAAATEEQMILNIWFDGNRDGDWQDVGVCEDPETGQQARSYEWVLQDFAVDLTAIPAGGYQDINVTTVLIHNSTPGDPHWMRFMLSEQEAVRNPATNLADGRGPVASYEYGETEDVRQQPQPAGQPGDLILSKGVISSTTPVGYGDTVTYTINLKHQGGTEPIGAEIRDRLTFPQHLIGPVQVTEVTPGVTPLFATVEYDRTPLRRVDTIIRWQGALAPNAEMQIAFPVHIHPFCRPGDATKEIVNVAQVRRLNGEHLEDEVRLEAACPGYSIADIDVAQDLVLENVDARTQSTIDKLGNFEIQDFRSVPVRTTFTNHAQAPLTIGFMVEISGVNAGYASRNALTETHIVRRLGQIDLEPGATDSIETVVNLEELLGRTLGEIPEDATIDAEIESQITYTLVPADLFPLPLDILEPDQLGHKQDRFKVRPWDVGDASDETNHAGTAMTTYGGVAAQFPTVFDPTTGLPQGPAHARPRPFHLGQGVDPEVDADLPPVPRNIVPPTNVADQDAFDDGANPNAWLLNHCRPATVPVRIFISPAAVTWFSTHDGIGYINGWIDSNRDGSWDDTIQCPPDPNLPTWAPEHIIIDQPVDVVALGVGLHTLTVNTGRVPWPLDKAQQPAWVRLTLSEQKSNKTLITPDGTSHGDGRGYNTPFRTGETEDYLLRPDQNGPDMAVGAGIRWQPLTENADPDIVASSLNFEEIKVTFRAGYGNRGTQTAQNVSIKLHPPLTATITSVAGVPALDPAAIDREGNEITVDLGEVEAGARGVILLTATVSMADLKSIIDTAGITAVDSLVVDFTVHATSLLDVNPTNDEATATLLFDDLAPRFGLRSVESPFLVRSGTTCSAVVDLHGAGTPNSDLIITLSSLHNDAGVSASTVLTHWRPLTETVKIGPNGGWTHRWTSLSSGSYRTTAFYSGEAQNRLDKSSPKLAQAFFNVNTDLIIDPMTLAFVAENGRIFQPNTLNWAREGWRLHLPAGTYNVGINACGTNSNTQIAVEIDGAGMVALADEDGDGRYEGSVTIGESQSRSASAERNLYLTVTTHDGQTVYKGIVATELPGKVENATDGVGLANAIVTLFEVVEEGIYASWNGADYGQPNPQNSSSDGSYSFSAPAGLYRIYAAHEGYQAYRSDDLDIVDLVNEVISLSPSIAQTTDVVIAISESGFSPAILDVKPGSVIEFVNVGGAEHRLQSGANWDSGILLSGERYKVVAGDVGVISVSDGLSAANVAQITIDPLAGQWQIFLPTMQR